MQPVDDVWNGRGVRWFHGLGVAGSDGPRRRVHHPTVRPNDRAGPRTHDGAAQGVEGGKGFCDRGSQDPDESSKAAPIADLLDLDRIRNVTGQGGQRVQGTMGHG